MFAQDLPKNCEKCSATLPSWQRMHRKLSKMAVLLIVLGLLLVLPWAGLIFLVYHNSDTIIIPVGPVSTFIALVIVSAPAIGLAFVAANMRKVVDLRCRECGWKKRFPIDKPGSHKSC